MRISTRTLLLSPLVVLLLVATRLLLVANYNSDTAVTLVRLDGVTDTVLGAAIPLLPLLLPTATILLFASRQYWTSAVAFGCTLLVAAATPGFSSFAAAWRRATQEALWFLIGLAEIFLDWAPGWLDSAVRTVWGWVTEPWFHPVDDFLRPSSLVHVSHATEIAELWQRDGLLVVICAVAAAAIIFSVDVDPSTGDVKRGRIIAYTVPRWMLAVFFKLLTALGFLVPLSLAYWLVAAIYPVPPADSGLWQHTLHRFWQPPERVVIEGGRTEVGYFLGVHDQWLVLLRDGDRSIEYLRPGRVVSRSVCSLRPAVAGRPLIASGGVRTSVGEACYPGAPPSRTPSPPPQVDGRSTVRAPRGSPAAN